MCHLILLLPLLALALFFFVPFEVALPVYLTITATSAFIYFAIVSAMKKKVQTGKEGMIGQEAVVTQDINPRGSVMVQGELWSAVAHGNSFRRGDKVRICAVQGMELIVEKPDDGGHHSHDL